ncbi:MAG: cold-shock protein [Hyphomonadaceae bacterium]|nr:cold-shock protein [Hyphomonadaceae bacterium]
MRSDAAIAPRRGEGDTLSIEIERGDRGYQVVTIEELIKVERPIPEDIDSFERVVVRWFNRSKGYGFVSVLDENGQEIDNDDDVFLHIATMRRAGIEAVEEGQSLRARIDKGPKGAIVSEVYAG